MANRSAAVKAAWITGGFTVVVAVIGIIVAIVNKSNQTPNTEKKLDTIPDISAGTKGSLSPSTVGSSSHSTVISNSKDSTVISNSKISPVIVNNNSHNTIINDSIWLDLTRAIERDWRDKPRKELVQAVVVLRNAMIRCQQWYLKYKGAEARGENVDQIPYPNPKVEWTRSLTELGEAIAQLDQVFSIFSPETKQALFDYNTRENLLAGAEGSLNAVATGLGKPSDIDVERVKIGPTFDTALKQLDLFIKTNFKHEEIFSVRDRFDNDHP